VDPVLPVDTVPEVGHSELLRLTTAGSVDDGKSTLIGRLLYDSKGVYETNWPVSARPRRQPDHGRLDLSLLTDGLRAEREQASPSTWVPVLFHSRRKFIIADTPGHEQYTRNMATRRLHGRPGDRTHRRPVRRAAAIAPPRLHASLLGIPQIVWRSTRWIWGLLGGGFQRHPREFTAFSAQLDSGVITFIP